MKLILIGSVLALMIASSSSHAATERREPTYSQAYKDCLKHDQDMDSKAQACARAEVVKLDSALNDIYRQLATKIEPDDRVNLQAAERAWIDFRDKDCNYVSGGAKAGTLDRVWGAQCVLRQTYFRLEDLRDYLKTANALYGPG
jgi:uncharacterized protein YecT (DUF1311 family)